MSTLDILYIGIMVVALTVSSFRGGVREIFSLAAVVVGFVAASRFYSLVSGQVLRLTSHEEVNNIISFIIIFLFVAALTSYVGGQLSQLIKKVKLGFWNMMAGTAIGTIKGLFVCSLITYVLLVFMKPDGGFFLESRAFPFVSQLTMTVSPIGPKDFRDELEKKLKIFGKNTASGPEKPEKNKKVEPAKPKPPAVKEKTKAPLQAAPEDRPENTRKTTQEKIPQAGPETPPGEAPAKAAAEASPKTTAETSAEPAPETRENPPGSTDTTPE